MKEIKLQRNNKNNPQIREYTDAIKRGNRSQHIVHSNGEWRITSGDSKKSASFSTKNEAVDYARKEAKTSGSSLFIHNSNGRISSREDYGPDSHPPRR